MSLLKLRYTLLFWMELFLLYGCVDEAKRSSNLEIDQLDTISFGNLSKISYQYLNRQQDSCKSIYKIDRYQNWYYDQYSGELTFSDGGVKKLVIDYEEVGSLSFKSNTWLWAWKNPHLEKKVKSQIRIVRDFGIKRHFNKLTNPKWIADQYDAWEMTAISAYLMRAKGAYRVPSKDSSLYSFMIYKDIRWADTSKPKTTTN